MSGLGRKRTLGLRVGRAKGPNFPKPCIRIGLQRLTKGIGPAGTRTWRLRGQIAYEKGAELRHYSGNKNRDLSLRMWVEVRPVSGAQVSALNSLKSSKLQGMLQFRWTFSPRLPLLNRGIARVFAKIPWRLEQGIHLGGSGKRFPRSSVSR